MYLGERILRLEKIIGALTRADEEIEDLKKKRMKDKIDATELRHL